MHALRRAALRCAIAASRPVSVSVLSSLRSSVAASKPTFAFATRRFTQTPQAFNTSETAQGDSFFQLEGQPKGFQEGETPYGLFVRNLIFDANEDHLKEIFGKYGEIVNAVIARDPRGLSRGYGFVFFKDAETMNRAGVGANGMFWHGRRLMCNPRVKKEKTMRERSSHPPTRSIYIGNIPYESTDAELNRLFRGLPNLWDVRVAVDRTTGWPRGFAHADFTDVESAAAAVKKLQGSFLAGRELRIDFAEESANLKSHDRKRSSETGADASTSAQPQETYELDGVAASPEPAETQEPTSEEPAATEETPPSKEPHLS